MRKIAVILAMFVALGLSAQGDDFAVADGFSARQIPAEVQARMQGKSYKSDCTIPLDSLRYLTVKHVDAEGREHCGELVCHVSVARDLLEIFYELYRAKYPIERMQLVDDFDADDLRSMQANNSSAFNFRVVEGTTKLSKHAQGLAIDINPLYNPWVKRRKDGSLYVSPEEGRRYADRSAKSAYMIQPGDLAHRLFLEHGFKWGGAWRSSKDYQHFER